LRVFFRSCSEHTMTVLRNNADLLLLIVEVFVHDPLYEWSLSPIHAAECQASIQGSRNSVHKNTEPQRVLLKLREKLKGYEEGEYLSVKGQVNKLIKTAQNEELLSQMYFGWGPHL